jgi:hypothetical protein
MQQGGALMRQYQLQHRRGNYSNAKLVESDDEASIYGGDFDDNLPPRMSRSSQRYSKHADVMTETGRTRPDVQSLADERFVRTPRSGNLQPTPARASQTNNSTMRSNSNRRRYVEDFEDPPVQPQYRRTEDIHLPRIHWLVFVGLAMVIMIIGWVLLTMFANWWQITQDNWHYGYPRTYQVDEVVGHNDSAAHPSHFIALNLNSHVEVIEFPGGDPSKAKVYLGPTLIGPNANLAPVTLTFKDVNGDGKLDMIVNVQGSHLVFINDSGQFRPAKPSDNVQIGNV